MVEQLIFYQMLQKQVLQICLSTRHVNLVRFADDLSTTIVPNVAKELLNGMMILQTLTFTA